jgi:hypothetical protein
MFPALTGVYKKKGDTSFHVLQKSEENKYAVVANEEQLLPEDKS